MKLAYVRGTGLSRFVLPQGFFFLSPTALHIECSVLLQVNGKDAVSLEHGKVVSMIKGEEEVWERGGRGRGVGGGRER